MSRGGAGATDRTLAFPKDERDNLRRAFLGVLAREYPKRFEALDALAPVFERAQVHVEWSHSGLANQAGGLWLPDDLDGLRFAQTSTPADVLELLGGLEVWARELRLFTCGWAYVLGAEALEDSFGEHTARHSGAEEAEGGFSGKPASPTQHILMSARTFSRQSAVDEARLPRPPQFPEWEPWVESRKDYLAEVLRRVDAYTLATAEFYRASGM